MKSENSSKKISVQITPLNLEIKKSDLSEVVKFKKWLIKFLPYLRGKFTDDYLTNRIKNVSRGEVLRVNLENKAIGFLAWFEEKDGNAYLWLIVVLPQYRNQGIGNFLINTALKKIKKLKYKKVYAKIKNDNYLMLANLIKRGFYIKKVVNDKNFSTVFVEKLLRT